MKNLIKSAIIASTLIVAAPSFADAKSDNALLTECRQDIKANGEGATNADVARIKSRRGLFTAKFKVTANGERFVMQCASEDGTTVAITCVDGTGCDSAQVVAH